MGSPPDDERDITDIFPAIDPEGPVNDDPTDDLPPVEPIIGTSDPVPDSEKSVVRIEIPYRTIIRVVLSLLVIWLLVQVSEIVLLVLIALILTLALVPPTRYLERRGLPRVVAAAIIFVIMAGIFAGFVALIVPPLVNQGQSIIDNFPEYSKSLERIIARYPSINERYQEIRQDGLPDDFTLPWNDVMTITTGIVGGVANLFFVVTLTFYLLIEGERSYTFLARYFTPRLRYRIRRAFPELTRVVSGFVIGQLITSSLFAVFAYVLLLSTGTPEPLLLAMVAFVLDAAPIRDSYVLRYAWQGDREVSWSLAEPVTILRSMDGSYVLEDADGATRVTYQLAVDVSIPLLGMLKRKAEKVIIDTALRGLKARVESA